MAQPRDRDPQLISVKSRTFKHGAAYVGYLEADKFDWLAIVLLPGEEQEERRFFIIPRKEADAEARRDRPTAKTAAERYYRIDEVAEKFSKFERNFSLRYVV